jgi:adenylosuccinate lyase
MSVDRRAMARSLSDHPEVMAEAAQISMRLSGDRRGYEKVKSAIERGDFKSLSRHTSGAGTYSGMASSLARSCPARVKKLLSSMS